MIVAIIPWGIHNTSFWNICSLSMLFVAEHPQTLFPRNKERKKTKHAHMKMEIKENATRTNTN
jgi:hypothetical protein